MNDFSLTIVIPSRNEKQSLEKLFTAIDHQTILPEKIVIVDSSPDQTVEKTDVQTSVTFLRETKAYPGKARNIGARLVKSEWIAFLDSKTIPEKDWLERTFNLLEAHSADAVFGVTRFNAKTPFQRVLRAATYGKIGHHTVPGTLIKKKVFEESGGFLENIRMGEDIEWRERLADQGYIVHRPVEPTLTYSGLPTTFFSTLKKYLISSYHSARVNIQRNVKDIYLTLALVLSTIIIPKWNYLIGDWDANPLYIPNVNKIYLLSIIALLLMMQLFRWFFAQKTFDSLFSRSLKIVVFIFVTLGVYRWNAVIAGWMEDAVLYLPHITKIYVSTVITVSILNRGLFQPLRRKVETGYLFPFRWVGVGFLGLFLDLVKAPAYIFGALVSMFKIL